MSDDGPLLPRPLHIRRDPDRARDSATEETVVAVGVQMPSNTIIIEWNRKAFDSDERAAHPVKSEYRSVADAEQATGGTVVFKSMKNKQTPEACPHCRYTGAFGGLGKFYRSFERQSINQPAEHVSETWAQMHCSNCGNEFALKETEETDE